MKAGWPGAVARAIGLSGDIDWSTSRVGLTLHVPCRRGKHVADFEVPAGLHPNGIAKRMLQRGWTVGHGPSCPEHSRPERKPRSTSPKKEPEPMAAPAPNDNTPAAASEAAKIAKRLVLSELEDGYDDVAKAYKPGYSDAGIAKAAGVAGEVVAKLREEFYGPLGEPAELASLRKDLETLQAHAVSVTASISTDIAKLNQRLVTICKANGWPHPV